MKKIIVALVALLLAGPAMAGSERAFANVLEEFGRQQQQAEARARGEQVARTVASARARLAGGGIASNEGSAATVAEGLQADAAAGQADSDALFRARLSSGRASLLNPDGSLTSLLRALPSFGNSVRSLLD